ncbi:MAG: hypothetical protein KTR29_03640 [Rhodothermaceae bacterium]|nr:hypothetical protein [Rhodothermaceae bacterium]
MNKPVLAILVSIVFFIVGLAATYFAMPMIAPEMVDEVQHRLDSLAEAESKLLAMDSLLANGYMPDSLMVSDSLPSISMLSGLRDSLSQLMGMLEDERQQKDTLLFRIQSMEQRWVDLSAKYAEAGQMSNTITKMEDKELEELLEKLDDDVLESMYIEASARNRARLLQMLPADKAALLVNRLTDPSFSLTTDATPDKDPSQQE